MDIAYTPHSETINMPPAIPRAGPPSIAPLLAPSVERLQRLGTSYHAWALRIRASLLLSDPELWAVTSGLRPKVHGDFLAMEQLHLKATSWIYLHLPDDVLNSLVKRKDLEADAHALWKEIRRRFAPEECVEGNEACVVCARQSFAFVDQPDI